MRNYKYCAYCAGKLKRFATHAYACAGCGQKFFLDAKITVTIVVENRRGEVLLGKRKLDPRKGLWDTPGGFAEIGETAEVAARRETWEETGIRLGKLTYLGTYADKYRFGKENKHLLVIGFRAKINSARVRKGRDVEELRFYPPAKIPYRQIAHPSDKKALRDFLRQKQKLT